MKASRPADEDRLPWLEPYRDAKKPGRPLPRRGYGKPLVYGMGIGLLVAVGAGGYWLGQQDEMKAPATPSATVALPAPKPAPVQIAQAPPVEPAAEQAAPAPAKVTKPKASRKKSPARKRKRVRKIHSAGVETEQLNSVRAAQERQAPPPPRPVSRPWPKMPSPGPAGQVIQLGAFTTPGRANAAYYQRISRYKLLAGMPKVVVPVITKPDRRVLYVLRLGTTSRQQSKYVCRNMRRSGDHCLVIG